MIKKVNYYKGCISIYRLLYKEKTSPPQSKNSKVLCNRMAPVAVGDAIPSVDLFENTPGNKVS